MSTELILLPAPELQRAAHVGAGSELSDDFWDGTEL